ncbi:hypothetical protein BX666DRAFT_2032346 [Dichotomocladium elegans]|nr:hypothetical protein BX666DRAFT_2032346 [Dichotomocladium elegans]
MDGHCLKIIYASTRIKRHQDVHEAFVSAIPGGTNYQTLPIGLCCQCELFLNLSKQHAGKLGDTSHRLGQRKSKLNYLIWQKRYFFLLTANLFPEERSRRDDLVAGKFQVATARPKDGIDAVQERVKQGRMLDEELVTYFRERAQIEQQYARSLDKAAKKLYVTDKTLLGNFAPVWDLLFNELTEISTAHAMLSYKIADEIEKPLKNPPSEYSKVKSMEATFANLAKEYDENAKKNKKSGDKSASLFKRSNKDNSISKRGMESALATWQKEGPQYLMHHQLLEESRLQRLKTLVVRFGEIQTEHSMKRMELVNLAASAATELDVDAEIKRHCNARGHSLVKISGQTQSRRPSAESQQTSHSSFVNRSESDAPRSLSSPKSNRVKSTFSIRRMTRNGSATRLPDTQAFGTIDEESNGHTHHADLSNSRVSQVQDAGSPSSPVPSENQSAPIATPAVGPAQPTETPAVDDEGYTIPPVDRSAYTTALQDSQVDEFDNEGSLASRLKIDIREDAIKASDPEANAALNRMSTLLRDRTPSVSRRPRGRRENIRSMHLDSSAFGSQHSLSLEGIQSGSAISSVSTTPTNPFNQNSVELSTPSSQSPVLSYETTGTGIHPIGSEAGHSQIYASIIEVAERDPAVNELVRISGQIKLVYHGPSAAAGPLLLRLNSPGYNAQIKTNTTFVEPFQNESDIYILKAEAFDSFRRTPVTCFVYQFEAPTSVLPINLQPAWKCIPESSYLIVKYQTTDAFVPQKSQVTVQVKYDSAEVANVQSTPQGAWDVTKKVLTWQTDLAMQQPDKARLLAKFITTSQGTPAPVVLRILCKDQLLSQVGIDAVPAFGSTLQVKRGPTVTKSEKIIFI